MKTWSTSQWWRGSVSRHPLFSYRKLRRKPPNLQANREELSTLDASDGRPWVTAVNTTILVDGKVAMISSTPVNISSMPVDFFKGGRVNDDCIWEGGSPDSLEFVVAAFRMCNSVGKRVPGCPGRGWTGKSLKGQDLKRKEHLKKHRK